MTGRGRFLILLLLSAVLLAGCEWGQEPAPCECPHLEEGVDAVNWAPGFEGQPPIGLAPSGDQYGYLFVDRIFVSDSGRPDEMVERVSEAASAAGYEVTVRESGGTTAVLGPLQIDLSPLADLSNGLSGMRVLVMYRGDDGPHVPDELKSLRESLEDR